MCSPLLNYLYTLSTTPRSMHGVGVTALVATGKVHGAARRAQTNFRQFAADELEVWIEGLGNLVDMSSTGPTVYQVSKMC